MKDLGASMVVQLVNLPIVFPASRIGLLARVAVATSLRSTSLLESGNAADYGLNSCTAAMHVGNLKGALGFWLKPDLTVTVTAMYSVKQQTDLSLCSPLLPRLRPFFPSLSFK